MNRLVRIALTLFVSATILVFLTGKRAGDAQKLQAASPKDPAITAMMKREVHMAWLGLTIAGGMIGAGMWLVIVAYLRSRKKPSTDG